MENAREVAATEIFCHGLREHDVDTEVYSSYVVVLLQGADDCDIDSAVADAVEALSAVLEEDVAQSLVQQLHHNLNTDGPMVGGSSSVSTMDKEPSMDECRSPQDNDSSGETAGVGLEEQPSLHISLLANDLPEVDSCDFGGERSSSGLEDDVAPWGIAMQSNYDSSYYSDMDSVPDDGALAEFFEDPSYQQWISSDSRETEHSMLESLRFHFSRRHDVPCTSVAGGNDPNENEDQGRPCIFFLSGTCRRADCQFSHNISSTPCKYWASGSCLRGSECPFSHISAEPVTPTATRGGNSCDVQFSDGDFPCLSSGNTSASHVQPVASPPSIGRQWTEKVKTQPSAAAVHQAKVAASRVAHVKGGGASIKWVDVGDTLSELYADLRHQAIAHGSTRNKFFQNALEAYKAGDKAAASRFSREGRYYDKEMKTLNEKAAQEMFQARNADLPSHTIDLHGLHVPEAISYLDAFLSKLHSLSGGRPRHAYIITGTGHHSVQSGYKAKLQPTIVAHLRRLQIEVVDCSKDRRGGVLRVTL